VKTTFAVRDVLVTVPTQGFRMITGFLLHSHLETNVGSLGHRTSSRLISQPWHLSFIANIVGGAGNIALPGERPEETAPANR